MPSEGEESEAAGRGLEQNQCAHDDRNLRAGSYMHGGRGGRSGSLDGGDRRPDHRAWASSRDGSGDGHHDVIDANASRTQKMLDTRSIQLGPRTTRVQQKNNR